MSQKIELPLALVESLIEDLESGYIANPSVRADKIRERYLRQLKAALAESAKEKGATI